MVKEAKNALARYVEFTSNNRPHPGLGYRMVKQVYFSRTTDHTDISMAQIPA